MQLNIVSVSARAKLILCCLCLYISHSCLSWLQAYLLITYYQVLSAIAMNVFNEQKGSIALYTSPRAKEGATIAILIELLRYVHYFLQFLPRLTTQTTPLHPPRSHRQRHPTRRCKRVHQLTRPLRRNQRGSKSQRIRLSRYHALPSGYIRRRAQLLVQRGVEGSRGGKELDCLSEQDDPRERSCRGELHA
jgi:hypothetical protein